MEITTRITRPKATRQIFHHLTGDAGLATGDAIRIADKLVKHFTRVKTKSVQPGIPPAMQAFVDAGEIDIDQPIDRAHGVLALDEAVADGGWKVMADETDFMSAYLNEGVYDPDFRDDEEIPQMEEIW